MKNSTQIRIGMLSIGAAFWILGCALDYFIFGMNTFLKFDPQELYMRFSLVLLLVFSGELVVRLEKNVASNREERERLEREKSHIYYTGLFGNSKEIRNKVMMIGQAAYMLKHSDSGSDKAIDIIEETSRQIMDVLDTTQQDLEKKSKIIQLNTAIT